MAPPEGVSVVNVMTPRSAASSPTAGPPELPCAAAASVCTMSWPMESCLKPETAPLVTDASSVADLLSSSCDSTTPGKPMMCTGSPICASRSLRRMAGYTSSFTRTSARSRPASGEGLPLRSKASGGLNLTTSALRLTPLDSSTDSSGCGVTCAVAIARAVASRRIESSRSGRWPRISPWARSAGSTHAWSIAFFFSSWMTHGGMRCAGSTTCALVTR